MLVLDKKCVFHVPLFKFEDGNLMRIDCDVIRDLVDRLDSHSLYITKVKSHYRNRSYDELLFTLFTSSDEHPEEIFKCWFKKNNDVLCQESFAFELDGKMYIERL